MELDAAAIATFAPAIGAFFTGVGVMFAGITLVPTLRKVLAEKARSQAETLSAQMAVMGRINERLIAQVDRLEAKLALMEAKLDHAEAEIDRLIGLLKSHGIPH